MTEDLIIPKDKLLNKLDHITKCDGAPKGSSVALLAQNKEKVNPFELNPKYSHQPNIRTYEK